VLLSLVICSFANGAVSQAGVLFLTISPSTVANGMGQTYSPLSYGDSFQNYFFPGYANEHYASLTNGFKNNWLPQFGFSDLYYDIEAYQIGFPIDVPDFSNMFFSLSYYDILLNMGSQPWTDETGDILGTVESWDKAQVLRFGVSWGEQWPRDWLSQTTISAGWGLDFIRSNLATGVQVGSQVAHEGRATSWDWGLSATSRVLQSSDGNIGIDLGLQVSENFISNEEIYYADMAQADPLPRQARLTMACAAEWRWHTLPLGRLHLAWGKEVSLLNEGGGYKSLPSTIFDVRETTNSGLELTLANTLTWRFGSFNDDPGHIDMNSWGWGIQTQGIGNYLHYLPALQQNRYLNLFFSRFNLFYNYSSYDAGENHPLTGTIFQEVGISFGR
jgi:hypothetical protein